MTLLGQEQKRKNGAGTRSYPPGLSSTQSYSYIIRNIFYDALAADPFFATYFMRKTPMVPVQREQLPFLGVYIANEDMTPDGDANATVVRFTHMTRIGFSAIVAYSDQDVAEQTIDAIFWHIMNRLWTDPDIMNMINAYDYVGGIAQNPDNVRIESIERGVRRHRFGSNTHNNETPVAELQYDVTCKYRTMWWPDITDTLDTIDVKTGVKAGDTQDEMNQRAQEHVTYDFTPPPAPTVTAISPTSGSTTGGTGVTITGTDLTGTTAVTFGSKAVSFRVVSATSITVVSPAGTAGVVDLTVTTPSGTSATSSADQFTYQ